MTDLLTTPVAALRSVLLCSDILATRESEQMSNLRWVRDLLERPIGAALAGAEIRAAMPQGFDRASILRGSVEDVALRERHCLFDPDALSEAALSNLGAAIGPDTLVVGYELSRATRTAFDRADIPWIDIWLHPVRFADDILFGMRASDPRIQTRIDGFAITDEALSAQADLLKIQNYRGFNRFDRPLVDGAALFIGQTSRDKSVLAPVGFLGPLDFREAILDIATRHPHLYFSRHPNEPRLDPRLSAFLGSIGNLSEIDAPTYKLLADPRIATVASISSSVLEEARYFGKATERLFQPPFPLVGPAAYATILHSLCFSHFWAEILQDVAAVASVPVSGFLDPRNKLRHALSFYWGYRDIDRYEALSAFPEAKRSDAGQSLSVETADVVSFDVFDTLITRRVTEPRDVFALMAPEAAAITGLAPSVFPDRRMIAEKAAMAAAAAVGREDPTLAEICRTLLGAAPGDPRVERLAELEIATERDLVRSRPAGRALFDRAVEAGQRIILVSDMYLPREAVEDLLTDCGYAGWETLYLSSERGTTKRSGTLFEEVLGDLGVAPDRVIHIGDNPRGDLAVPESLGITCQPLPRPIDRLERGGRFLRKGATRIRETGLAGGSAILAQIGERFDGIDEPPAFGEVFGKDPSAFGYVALGPFLAGFAEWLHEATENSGSSRLGFLTREGPVFRAAFEALFPETGRITQTVFASRRIVRNASFLTPEDVAGVALGARSGHYRDLADLLEVEFGLPRDAFDAEVAKVAGFDEPDHAPGPSTPRDALQRLVDAHTPAIIANSTEARCRLANYLADVGLATPGAAVVDIGYAGRVQAGFSAVTSTPLGGFYVATFRTSAKVLGDLQSHAFLASSISPNDRKFGLCRHRRIYETLLCAPGPSYVGIERTEDGWRGVPDSQDITPVRDAFLTAAHAGALEFVRDYALRRRQGERISPMVATAFLDAALDAPSPRLARWLGALEFDDRLDAVGPQTLVGAAGASGRLIWPEAATVLARTSKASKSPKVRGPAWEVTGPYGVLGWRHAMTPVVAAFVAWIGDPHDADHFRDDPIGFFRRLSDRRFRRIGRILYPWD